MNDDQRIKELYEAHLRRKNLKDKLIGIAIVGTIFVLGMWAWYQSDTTTNTTPNKDPMCVQVPTSADC